MRLRRPSGAAAAVGEGERDIPLVSSATTACMSPGMMGLKGGTRGEQTGCATEKERKEVRSQSRV